MRRSAMRLRTAGMIAAALLGTCVSVHAQTYPTRDMRVVVGLPAGSGGDVVVRYYADKLAQVSGRTVIVENKPGMILSIGADAVAKAPPDGYTILITSVTCPTIPSRTSPRSPRCSGAISS
jgi:tripartite-type tricarboxylate transporter receptor subunit TctC